MSNVDLPIQSLSPADLLVGGGTAGLERAARRRVRPPTALVQAAKDFESVLLQQLMEEMSNTIPSSGLLDSSTTKQVQGMFWGFLAQDVSAKGGMGLWKDLYGQFADMAGREVAGPRTTTEPSP